MVYSGGYAPNGSALTTSQAQSFIPELWMREIKRYLQDNLVMSRYTRNVPFGGQAGDTIRMPELDRLGVNNKLPGTPVSFQSRKENEYTMTIDQYKESSIAVEDITQIQSHTDMRQLYTQEAARALARDMDDFLLGMRAAIVGENPSEHHITSTNPIQYSDILEGWEILNENRVPKEGRVLVVSPQQEASMLTAGNIGDPLINSDATGGINSIGSGVVGRILGMPVVMTTALQKNTSDGFSNGADGTTGPTPGYDGSAMYYPTQDSATGLKNSADGLYSAVILHSDYCNVATQKEPSVDAQWSTDYQEWHVVQTQIYGVKLYRPNHAVVISTKDD